MDIRFRDTGVVMTDTHFNSTICTRPITPELLEEYNADAVLEGPSASTMYPYEFSYRDGVEQDNQGRWYTKYSVGPVFADSETDGTAAEQMARYKSLMDEEQKKRIREERNIRLTESDWTQAPDCTANKTAWATYRQALRDIPTSEGFPWNVTWPTSP